MEQRVFERVDVDGMAVDISGQESTCSGSVSDISRFGICLEDLPKKIRSNESKLTIIVSGHGEKFRMHIRPRWSVLDGWRKSLGASIPNPSREWLEFVKSFEPVAVESA